MRRLMLCALAACGGSSAGAPEAAALHDASPDAGAQYHSLPFSGGPDAPILSGLQYRCNTQVQFAYYVEAQIMVTDPQGPADLTRNTQNHVGMFPTDPPSGTERLLDFRFAPDGTVDWGDDTMYPTPQWGQFYTQATDPAIYNAICAASTWPMDILVADNSGHITSGLVRGQRIDCCH